MKDAFGWIQKIKDLATKNALSILSENLRKLDSQRVAALEEISHHNLLSDIHHDTVPSSPPNDGDIIQGLNGKWEPFSLGAPGLFLTSTGSSVDWDDIPPGVPLPHAASHESGGTDIVASGEVRETSGPTDLVVGAIVDGEFLKRVGGTLVSAAVSGASVPTGTGFRHITAGAEDAASKLVDTADINDNQVTYAKLQNIATNTLLGRGSVGAGDVEEISIGSALQLFGLGLDLLIPVAIASGGTGAVNRQSAINNLTDVVAATNEHVLTKDTGTGLAIFKATGTPAAHATSHQNGGSDEINVAGLSGLLADQQNPTAHAASHQDGGVDEILATGLSGLLADPQTPLAHATSHERAGSDVVAASEINTTTGPTDLVVGAIADGQFLKRVGATIIGAAAGGGSVALSSATIDFPFPPKIWHKDVAVLDGALTGLEKLMLSLAGSPGAGDENTEDDIDLEYMYAASDTGGFLVSARFKTPFAGSLKINYLVG